MLRVLYTYRNFECLTDKDPGYCESGNNHILKSDFIDDVMYKAFRIVPERPPVNLLTELGYCYSNGCYYYTGGYTGYFATVFGEISDVFHYGKDDLYVVFTDSYTANGVTRTEQSTARAARDEDGFYLTAIHMDADFSDISTRDRGVSLSDAVSEKYPQLLITVIILFAIAAIGIIIYAFIV